MATNIPPDLQPHAVKTFFEILFLGLTALGTVSVAILAIWGNWFRARLAPAKLIIVRDESMPDLTIFTDQAGRPIPGHNRVYFYHLKVVNKRRWVAPKECRVLLKAMSRRGPDNAFQSIPMPVPLQYVWAPSEITPALISVEDEQVLDFGVLREGQNAFVPGLHSLSNNFQGFVRANDAIRYSLQIVSDNFVSPKYQVFEVAFDGIWTEDRIQMQNHLTIREIVSG